MNGLKYESLNLIFPRTVTLFLQPRAALTDAAFQTDFQQLLRFNSEFHRQLFENLLAKTIDYHINRVFGLESALTAVKQLVFANP